MGIRRLLGGRWNAMAGAVMALLASPLLAPQLLAFPNVYETELDTDKIALASPWTSAIVFNRMDPVTGDLCAHQRVAAILEGNSGDADALTLDASE